MKKLLLLLSVSLIFSCGPDSETVDAAKIMCDCSEDINFEDVDDSFLGQLIIHRLYTCLGDSDDFLSYLEMEKDTNLDFDAQNMEIQDKLTKVFQEKKMSIAIEDECPKIYLKMEKAGLIYEK